MVRCFNYSLLNASTVTGTKFLLFRCIHLSVRFVSFSFNSSRCLSEFVCSLFPAIYQSYAFNAFLSHKCAFHPILARHGFVGITVEFTTKAIVKLRRCNAALVRLSLDSKIHCFILNSKSLSQIALEEKAFICGRRNNISAINDFLLACLAVIIAFDYIRFDPLQRQFIVGMN